MTNLLELKDLSVEFRIQAGMVKAVDGVSFSIRPATNVAIVGESGSGKSTIAQAVMGILPVQPSQLQTVLQLTARMASRHLPVLIRAVGNLLIFRSTMSAALTMPAISNCVFTP